RIADQSQEQRDHEADPEHTHASPSCRVNRAVIALPRVREESCGVHQVRRQPPADGVERSLRRLAIESMRSRAVALASLLSVPRNLAEG
ncbi:MAG: hypothetical protein ACREQA_17350, partial [Candidatus Binatia bacterium]